MIAAPRDIDHGGVSMPGGKARREKGEKDMECVRSTRRTREERKTCKKVKLDPTDSLNDTLPNVEGLVAFSVCGLLGNTRDI